MRSFATSDDDETDNYEYTRSISFSDSVIRVRHFDTQYSSGALHDEILSLVHAQTELMAKGVIIRGGVTVGNIVADGNDLFGPGFNRAYFLESKCAIFPRIVVDAEAIQAMATDERLKAEHHDFEDEIKYLDGLLIIGGDGQRYVDYLHACYPELDEPERYKELLANHRQIIVDRAALVSLKPDVLKKYLWLACYHNGICKLNDYPDLFILESDITGLELWAREQSMAPVKGRRRKPRPDFE